MEYRNFGKTGVKTSLLGFGAMRLPVLDNDSGKIDEEKAIHMLRYAIDNGVNYVDTAYPYHRGNSEVVVGKALKNGYREKVFLATKSPVWLIEKHEDFERYFFEQLKRLDTDRVDMYLLHALNEKRWEKLKELRAFDFLEKMKVAGRVRFVGFSFHDKYVVFKRIVDEYDGWDFCQIQLNYMDTNYQAGLRGLKYAASKGLGVVIMEPLKGGKLARLPERALSVFRRVRREWPAVEWAFRWLASHPEVSVILSGMSTLEQVRENIEIFSRISSTPLAREEFDAVDEVKKILESAIIINCTECGYCMPCPNGVDIPGNFRLYNEMKMFEDVEGAKGIYRWFENEKMSASYCTACGTCLSKCPQRLEIPSLLEMIRAEMARL